MPRGGLRSLMQGGPRQHIEDEREGHRPFTPTLRSPASSALASPALSSLSALTGASAASHASGRSRRERTARACSLSVAAKLKALPRRKENARTEWVDPSPEQTAVPNLNAPLEPEPAHSHREDMPLPMFYARCLDYIKTQGASTYVREEEDVQAAPPPAKCTRFIDSNRLFNRTTKAYDMRKSMTLSRKLLESPERPRSSGLTRDMVFRYGVVTYPFATTAVLGELMIEAPAPPLTTLSFPHKKSFDNNTTKKPGGAARFFRNKPAGVGSDPPPPRPLRRKQVRALEKSLNDYTLARSRGAASRKTAADAGAGAR
eukprot:TRINITY_DN1556_c0_g2_i1.p1 TRINITY_DN1556_c0_g2~~TRINITY_DN1556_c0_g2_i1.p1  ORF type:complete len:359 (+),score=81.74 TRINITY_DN1556_c0_g2_i1:130-1077(+)